jgi:S1-C subfamily serine protease
MHIIGNKKSSYELKIDYVTHVLESIKQNKDVLIGDIGIDIELIDFKIAIRNYRLSVKKKSRNQPSNKKISSKLMAVSNVIEGSPAYGLLMPGDIILKVNKEEVGEDLLLLDQIMNKK